MKKIIAQDKFGWPIERTLAESAETGDDQSLAGSYEKHGLEPMLRKLAVNPAKLIKKVESDEGDQVVRVMKVSHPSHEKMIGIHLNDPSESEIDNAIDAAFRDGFEYIWIHSES